MKKNASESALAHYASYRTNEIRIKLRNAMSQIEQEIDNNELIYPFNGGRLSLSEVCRRAGVHKVTLQGEAHRATSKVSIVDWISSLKTRLVTGRKSVRKVVTNRADEWEARYKDIAQKFNEIYAIEVIAKNIKIQELIKKSTELESENLQLRLELSSGKVVQFPRKYPNHESSSNSDVSVADTPQLILIRGVPGSGKSTRAASLRGYAHFEADMYFVKNEKYLFESDLLPAAHQWCLQQAQCVLERGGRVVVSNIFVNAWEIKPYIDLGYSYKIIDVYGEWPSIHNVDVEKIERMRLMWVPGELVEKEALAMSNKLTY